MFTQKDLKQLQEKGISQEIVQEQVNRFEKGFPYTELVAPAIVPDGIVRIEGAALDEYIHHFEKASNQLDILKFVPASGAATRMFKQLFSWKQELESGKAADQLLQEDPEAQTFFSQIQTFAFWDNLSVLLKEQNQEPKDMLERKDYATLLHLLLDDEGLGYAMLPKGLLKFHRYEGFVRTPLEEHLVEGAHYARDGKGVVKIHFTVSAEHRGRFVNHVGDVLKRYEEKYGVQFEVSFSVQKPSTDTLAVDMNNQPFRETDGTLLFRPGGHGALIQNLNEMDQDVIFIKNIDNVVPDSLKEETLRYKKALGGMLVHLQEKIHKILVSMEDGSFSESDYAAARQFAVDDLFIDAVLLPDKPGEGIPALKALLNRPVRVCGMVKNEGEPGGGPFWVKNPKDGSRSLQIVESSQVNHKDKDQKNIFEQSTHFNPVDLVCGIRDYKGKQFDLNRFVDPSTGFISQKSKNGKDLKAQELPGLWNGAMAHWITVFVEVPLVTFNPVKTIMDLLRDEHR